MIKMEYNNLTELIRIPFGHRYIGFWGDKVGSQVPVRNASDVVDFVSKYLGLFNIGMSISTFKDNKPYVLFMPFDFDDENPINTIGDVVKLWNHFVESGIDSYLTFSGRKGFHILVSLVPKNYDKNKLKSIQKYIKNKFNLTTLDGNLFGDRRRLIRLPFTYNIINGSMCKLLAYNQGEKLDLDKIKIDYNPSIQKSDLKVEFKNYHEYPCIEDLVRNDPEPRHLIRFTYVILRLSKGWSEDDIIEEIKSFNWIDFDEEYTRKQIRQIAENGYYPLSCKSLIDLGYCSGICQYCDIPELLMKKLGVEEK